MNNPQEMTAKIAKETLAIQKGLGEKLGILIMISIVSIVGLMIAFYKGWSFTLVIIGCFPPLVISMTIMTTVMQKGFIGNTIAYSQSAGYAEQALNAMRLVAAFGQEAKEIKNYSKYLILAKQAGIKTHFKTALSLGFFMLSVFGGYALTYYLGGVWISEEIPNHTTGASYTSGDILSCLFGVIFGMTSLG